MKNYHNALRTAQSMKGNLIAFAIEKNCTYLYQAIVKFDNEYAVYLYNAEFDGFYNGYYTKDKTDAYNVFARRLTRR